MASDQSVACGIDIGRARAQLAFLIDADNDAVTRSTRRCTCGREEFHT
jgi:hypothetical protein